MVPKGTAILAAPGAVGIEAGTALAGAGIAPAGIKTAPKALSFWKDKAMWKQWGTMIAFTVGLYALSKISRSKTESEMMELQIQLMQSQVPTKEELVTQQMLQVLSADMMGGQGGVATPVNQPRGQGGIGLAPSERAVGGPPADQAELMRVLQSM